MNGAAAANVPTLLGSEPPRAPSDPGDNAAPIAETSAQLAERLDAAGCKYAFDGAIAMGYWTAPFASMSSISLKTHRRPSPYGAKKAESLE